jgi:GMP synthase PP-ATPase subunit
VLRQVLYEKHKTANACAGTPADLARSLGDGLAFGVALVLAGFGAALYFVKPAPPKHLVMSTGREDGAYHAFAKRYQEIFTRNSVTRNFMTIHWARLPYELLERISSRVTNEARGINRVVYDISGKPSTTIEWE